MAKIGQAAFTSGELDPALHARADLELYRTGLETCYNFIVEPQGGARNRPGTEYVVEVKDSTSAKRLVTFAFNDDDTYVLEFGEEYFRVLRNGAQVLLPSTPATWADTTAYVQGDYVADTGVNYYCKQDHTSAAANDQPGTGTNWTDYWHALTDDIVEVPHPFLQAELRYFDVEQNADVLSLSHVNHYPMKLTRSDHHKWLLETMTFEPSIEAPTGLSAAGGSSGDTQSYKVTAVATDSLEESLPSSAVSAREGNPDNADTITWTDVTDAVKYNIYKEKNGVYGFIGTSSDGASGYTDEKLAPETDDTPPASRDPFDTSTQYPAAVAYHEQRQTFGGAEPQRLDLSQTGNYFNFSVSEPAKDGDSLTLDIITNQIAQIRYVISQLDLLVFTAGAEVRVTSGENAFVLDNLKRKKQSEFGCARGVKPLLVGDAVLFAQRGGQGVRDFAYSFEADKFTGGELSVPSKHLLSTRKIVSWAYQSEPWTVVWAVCDDGVLLGLTIAKDHDVLAWHWHETDGEFEDVVTVPQGDTTEVYFVVKRTVNGSDVRYIEKLSTWDYTDIEDVTFLDSHVTGTITGTTISGLDHLEGEVVTALVGGDVVEGLTVTSGAVTLPRTYTSAAACIGLGYTSRLKTLEPPLTDAYGNEMSVARVQFRVLETRGLWAGPNVDIMTEAPTRNLEGWGTPNQPVTGIVEVVIEPTWDERGQVVLEQRDPLPSHILAMIPDVTVGG